MTCSALKRSYRDVLCDAAPTFFVHLHAPFEVLEERMQLRTKHFMPTTLLQSQFDTLEELGDDEPGAVIDVHAAHRRGRRGGRQRGARALHRMSESRERTNRSMLRVRDTIDRDYEQDLDIEALARWRHCRPTT